MTLEKKVSAPWTKSTFKLYQSEITENMRKGIKQTPHNELELTILIICMIPNWSLRHCVPYWSDLHATWLIIYTLLWLTQLLTRPCIRDNRLRLTNVFSEADVEVKRPVRNQFNYGERSAQTLNQQMRDCEIQTQDCFQRFKLIFKWVDGSLNHLAWASHSTQFIVHI